YFLAPDAVVRDRRGGGRPVRAVRQRELRRIGQVEPEDQPGWPGLDELHVHRGRIERLVGRRGGGIEPQVQPVQVEPEIDSAEEFPPGMHGAADRASLYIAGALPLVK